MLPERCRWLFLRRCESEDHHHHARDQQNAKGEHLHDCRGARQLGKGAYEIKLRDDSARVNFDPVPDLGSEHTIVEAQGPVGVSESTGT
eukprot:836152-Rhodomonas_salina.1